jgi:hypothetical protein
MAREAQLPIGALRAREGFGHKRRAVGALVVDRLETRP